MKRILLHLLLLWCAVCTAFAQGGIPSIRNFSPTEYQAHNRNFDIICGEDGFVFVANFEGLLYYDGATWRIMHTPGITRITELFRDSNGTVWAGGYNFIGKIQHNDNGSLKLASLDPQTSIDGEVRVIWEEQGQLFFVVGENSVYAINGNHISKQAGKRVPHTTAATYDLETSITQTVLLSNGLRAYATNGKGVIISDARDINQYSINESNGLCSDNVERLDYDKHGILWGATDNGVFAIAVPSAYSHFTVDEGLRGEVIAIEKMQDQLYVGTLSGLFRRKGMRFEPIQGINHACWDIHPMGNSLLAATSSGVFRVYANGSTHQLTNANTMALLVKGNTYYTGELDGVYMNTLDGQRQRISGEEKVTKIYIDNDEAIWLQNLYGQIWKRIRGKADFVQQSVDDGKNNAATLVNIDNQFVVVSAIATKPFPYPLFSYTDEQGYVWLTNNEGKDLYVMHKGKRVDDLQELLFPVAESTIRSMLVDSKQILLGDNNGLTLIDRTQKDPLMQAKPKLHLRSVVLNGDSVLWGGFGETPASLPSLSTEDRNLQFTYAVENKPLLGNVVYRYRIDGRSWSTWSEDTGVSFLNYPSGSYSFEVQARDALGRLTDIVSINFSIDYPIYQRWYMFVLYFLLFALAVFGVMRHRELRLERENIQLENIVQERTMKLREAQSELIRQEKMATVGKLTQGLIDRILNPLNYINNFSKLSEGLVKDLEANVEDEKEVMDKDNYEDTIDVIGMLRGNLQKVSEHGQNTTRTLKAMEEMLKDRTGGIVPMDLTPVLRQDEEMVRKYYASEISQYGIDLQFQIPGESLRINGNADQLSKTIMSLMGNSIYALVKKAQRQQYQPTLALSVDITNSSTQATGKSLTVTIRDNGIGIEETIIDKIFDPFFTTKTTSEAAGVGLYLSREIVQNHGGDISVSSVKNDYSEFCITLPLLTE